MRIVLKSLRTGQYCKGPDQWTSDRSDALDFLSSDEAIEFVRRHQMQDIQVVMQIRQSDHFITIPYEIGVLTEA